MNHALYSASIFEKGAFLVLFDDLFSVCYYLYIIFYHFFNTQLIFAQDKDRLISLSLRTVVSKNRQFHSYDFAVCLLEGMCGIETVKL